MARADLHPAWVWDCPDCGEENFARSMVYDMDSDEVQEMKEQHAIEEDEHGFYQSCPEEVECYSCGAVFDAWIDYPGISGSDEYEDLDEFDE